jgi:membrane peptidoglycan carboxypeptidase
MKRILLGVFADATVPKRRILNAYAGQVYLGRIGQDGIYGVREAARVYFGVSPEELTAAQIASIAATIRRPAAYAPPLATQPAVTRRLRVLEEMNRAGMIDPVEYSGARRALLRGDA